MKRWNDFLDQRRADVPPPFSGKRVERNVMAAITGNLRSYKPQRSRAVPFVLVGSTLVIMLFVIGLLQHRPRPQELSAVSAYSAVAVTSGDHTAIWLFPENTPGKQGE
ncbi:MAG: hypothetical protein OEM52_00480 [bacterium]|nr:hypothetical protein [bacterium]